MKRYTIRIALVAWVLIVIVLVVLIFSNRDSKSDEDQASLEVTCDQFLQDKHFTWNVQMQLSDSLLVTLCSNGTTGFQWSRFAQINDETVLGQTRHSFLHPETDNLGAAGKEEWTFKALRKGTTSVVLQYRRPWEGGEKGEWSLTATVVVN